MKRALLWEELWASVARRRVCIVGFSCCLAWLYTAMFSCALVPQDYGLFSSDTFWSVAALAEAAMAAVVLVRRGRGPFPAAFVLACSLATAAGTLVIRFGFFDAERYMLFYSIGAAVAGAGFAVLVLAWNARLRALVDEGIEVVVPSAFALSFAIYFGLFALKGSVAVFPIAALPVVSALLLFRTSREGVPEVEGPSRAPARRRGLAGEAAKMALLFFAAWFNFGFFRIFAAPDYVSDRTLYYLVPFSVALVAAFCILVFTIRSVHALSMSSAFRWVFALICLGYAVIFVDVHNDMLKLAGYAINFTCMFCVQICTFIVFPKLALRRGLPIRPLIAGLLVAEGLGVFAGVWTAKELYALGGGAIQPAWCFLVLAVFVAAGMVVGFGPERPELGRADEEDGGLRRERVANTGRAGAAAALGERYGFSPRELEIGALLLEGYSRPRVRDELYISLNTVNAHVKSIYAKAGVHSMQEFLLLARRVEMGEEEEPTSREPDGEASAPA